MASQSPQVSSRERPRPGVRVRLLLGLGAVVFGAALIYILFGSWVRRSDRAALEQARRHLVGGRTAAARATLHWLLWFEPNHDEALLLAARSLQAEGKRQQGAEMFGRIPPSSPRHESASYLRALCILNSGNFQRAEQALREHLSRYPDSEVAHEELKWLLFNLLRRREVEQLLTARLAHHPHEYALLRDLLYTEFRQQVPREAIGNLKKALELEPGQSSVVLALGYCLWRLGDVTSAAARLNQALALRPGHLETTLIAAEFLIEQNRLDASEKLLARVQDWSLSAASTIDDDRWWWLRGRLAQRRDDNDAAVKFIEKAVDLRPFELKYVHAYASLLQTMGRDNEANRVFEKAQRLESCESRLKLIVLSGRLERPAQQLLSEVASLCEQRGKVAQANGWRYLADHMPKHLSMRDSGGNGRGR